MGASEHRSPERPRSYIVGTYDKDAGPNHQRLCLNGARVAQMSDTLPLDLTEPVLRQLRASILIRFGIPAPCM
jgi:hypothetical protein